VYWLIQGFAAWIVAPLLLAGLLVPHLVEILRGAPATSVEYALLCGALWGVGGLTFGLAIRYLGIALGYAIALGLCTAFGTLIPPVYDGSIHAIVHERSGQVILAGVLICLIAVGVNGRAEARAAAGEADFSFAKGIAVAIFAGIMSSFFAFGLKAGAPIGAMTKEVLLANRRLDLWQNLPVLIVVLWGGFVTNFVWSAVLIVKNGSARQFVGAPGNNPMRAGKVSGETVLDFDPLDPSHAHLGTKTLVGNYLFASLAGVIWYFQFFFYSMGQTKMGRYDFSSWTLHMASIIIFATLWGLALREWKGTSRRTKSLVAAGLLLLVSSTIVVGYGNYMKAQETAVPVGLSGRR
jgi:L-rhamnose-H+ transport protein